MGKTFEQWLEESKGILFGATLQANAERLLDATGVKPTGDRKSDIMAAAKVLQDLSEEYNALYNGYETGFWRES